MGPPKSNRRCFPNGVFQSGLFRALWTFRIFFILSAWGSGRGSSRRQEGGEVRFLIENPRRGGLPG